MAKGFDCRLLERGKKSRRETSVCQTYIQMNGIKNIHHLPHSITDETSLVLDETANGPHESLEMIETQHHLVRLGTQLAGLALVHVLDRGLGALFPMVMESEKRVPQ